MTALASTVALPVECAGQEGLASPIVVPFERVPSPFIVICVPVASGPCEAMLLDTGTNMTLLSWTLAARVGLEPGAAHVVGVVAVLMTDVRDREEDGLVPTSFFRSVLVSSAEGLVIFDANLPLPKR